MRKILPNDLKMKNNHQIEKGVYLPLLRVDEALLTLIPSVKTSLPVRVVGKVEKVNGRYDQWVYGEISGKESRLSFRIPKEEGSPPIGSHVVIIGVFSIRPARFHEGLETLLSGQIDRESKEILEINKEKKKPFSIERKRPPTRMNSWITNNDSNLTRFALLGTNVGISDAAAAITQQGITPDWQTFIVSMVNSIDILKAIKHILKDKLISGFAFVRGGGLSSTMEVWEDEKILFSLVNSIKPFYTALGHSTDLILLDRIADESFETPSILGSQVGQSVNLFRERMNLKRQVEELTTKKQELEKAVAPLNEQIKFLEDKHLSESKQTKESNESIMKLIREQFNDKIKIKNYIIIAISFAFLFTVIYLLIR